MVFGNVVEVIVRAKDQFSRTFNRAKLSMQNFRKAALGAAAVGGALAFALAKTVIVAAKIEVGFSKVNTLLEEGQDAQELFADFVAKTNVAMGNQGDQLAVLDGLYQTISAGISDTAEAQEFLTLAVRAAVGGSAELSSVIEAGTKTMTSFGLGIENAERVFDIFAATVKAGQTTMGELARAFPIVAGTAGAMGATLEETAGILAGLTKVFKTPEQAAEKLRATFVSFQAPSKLMNETIEQLGFASGEAMIRQLGLVGAIETLAKTTDGGSASLKKMFGSTESLMTVQAILGAASKDVADSIDIVTNSTGLAAKQYSDMADDALFKWGQAMSEVQNLQKEVGDEIKQILGPALDQLIKLIKIIIEWWQNLSPEMKQAIVVFALVTTGIFLMAGAIALLMLVTSPLLLILLGIAAVVTAIILVWKNWDKIVEGFRERWNILKDDLQKVWDIILGIVDAIGDAISALGRFFSKGGGGGTPSFQHGGLVQQTGLALVHKGERVISRSRLAGREGGGMTIIIENLVGLDAEDISRSLREELFNKISL